MNVQHKDSVTRALYWVAVFLGHGYSLEKTQKELSDQLGINSTLSAEDDCIQIQMEGRKDIWSCRKEDLHLIREAPLDRVTGAAVTLLMPPFSGE